MGKKVDCELIDCASHAPEGTKCKSNVHIDGCGQATCYNPVPRSALVHAPVNPGCQRDRGKYRNTITGMAK